MSKQYLTTSWSSLAAGVAMLLAVALPTVIMLANDIGIGRAIVKIVIGLLIALWVIVGVVLVVRGLNKM